MQNSYKQFQESISFYKEAIGYVPLRNEPDPKQCLVEIVPLAGFNIPPVKTSDPVAMARQVSVFFGNTPVCIYVPGTAFDMQGVRHGRGGGWYDRFLSEVPPQWMRIGFCYENKFSLTSLKREAWDEPVDWVCVKKENEVAYYQTKARF